MKHPPTPSPKKKPTLKPCPPEKPKQPRVCLAFCRGSNEGCAIYLEQHPVKGYGVGYRVAGPKCWGNINTVQAFDLAVDDLRMMRKAATDAIKFLSAAARRAAGGGKR